MAPEMMPIVRSSRKRSVADPRGDQRGRRTCGRPRRSTADRRQRPRPANDNPGGSAHRLVKDRPSTSPPPATSPRSTALRYRHRRTTGQLEDAGCWPRLTGSGPRADREHLCTSPRLSTKRSRTFGPALRPGSATGGLTRPPGSVPSALRDRSSLRRGICAARRSRGKNRSDLKGVRPSAMVEPRHSHPLARIVRLRWPRR